MSSLVVRGGVRRITIHLRDWKIVDLSNGEGDMAAERNAPNVQICWGSDEIR